MTRTAGWLAVGFVALAACAQIINADFDDLKRKTTSTTVTGMAGSGEGGAGGTGGSDMGGAAGVMPDGSSTGGASGNGGLGGSGPEAGGSGGMREAGPDVVDAGHDSEPDHTLDAPKDQVVVDVIPDIVPGDGPTLGGVVINEINAQGALEDYIELHNNDSTPFDLSGYSVAQGMGMFGNPDTATMVTFAGGTTLGPGEYLLIVANQAPPRTRGGPNTPCNVPGFDGPPYNVTSCYWVDWGVSKSGERVYLLAPGGAVQDFVDFPIPGATQPPSGKSLGRFPNGVGPFLNAGTAWTPQAENHL